MAVYIDRLEDLMGELTHNEFFTRRFLEEVARLPKIDGKFIVSGLDETIFCRNELKQNEPLLKENPEEAINRLIKFQLGIPYIIAKYYQWKQAPKDIISLLSPNNSVFLTTGFEDIQKAKLDALWISHIPLVVHKEEKDKILSTIQYILYQIKYIPTEIVVYDDKPRFFLEYKELIEWIFWCTLTVMQVEMDGNNGYKKIEEI